MLWLDGVGAMADGMMVTIIMMMMTLQLPVPEGAFLVRQPVVE
jgi:hypothetical protein